MSAVAAIIEYCVSRYLRIPQSFDAPTLFNAHQKCLFFHLPRAVSNRLLSEVYASCVFLPMSTVFTLFCSKRKNSAIIAHFLLSFPLFYTASPGLANINLLLLVLPLALSKKESLCHHFPFPAFFTLFCYYFTGINQHQSFYGLFYIFFPVQTHCYLLSQWQHQLSHSKIIVYLQTTPCGPNFFLNSPALLAQPPSFVLL